MPHYGTLCDGVTEEEVDAIEATGWLESLMYLMGEDGKRFPAVGFSKPPLCLYQHGDLWIVSTHDYVIVKLRGSATACAAIAERILHLTDWAAINDAAKGGETISADLLARVEEAIFAAADGAVEPISG